MCVFVLVYIILYAGSVLTDVCCCFLEQEIHCCSSLTSYKLGPDVNWGSSPLNCVTNGFLIGNKS